MTLPSLEKSDARSFEDHLLTLCVQISSGCSAVNLSVEQANVCRVAAMVVDGNFPESAVLLRTAAATYFTDHPEQKFEVSEVIRKGWIFDLPRLRHSLERRLKKAACK